jgi:hypothetical protein
MILTGASGRTFVKLVCVFFLPKFQTETEQQLLDELEKVHTELEPLEVQRQQLEKGVETRTNVFVWGGLAFMAVQFGFLARLTWWEYSWDIMEPVTYFVTYATSMACYAYFVLTRQVRMAWGSTAHPVLVNPSFHQIILTFLFIAGVHVPRST